MPAIFVSAEVTTDSAHGGDIELLAFRGGRHVQVRQLDRTLLSYPPQVREQSTSTESPWLSMVAACYFPFDFDAAMEPE